MQYYVSLFCRTPKYGRLLPCPSHHGPPRVEHLVVKDGGTVLEYICKVLDLPPLWVFLHCCPISWTFFLSLYCSSQCPRFKRFVADLIHFGAVYYALVCPKPPPTATPKEIELYKQYTDPAVLSKRVSIKGKTVREAQKTFRITSSDEFVETGTYLRVYLHPKRFPRYKLVSRNDLSPRIQTLDLLYFLVLIYILSQVLWDWLEIKNYLSNRVLCCPG